MMDLTDRSYQMYTPQGNRAVGAFVDAVLRAEGDGADVLYAALREEHPEVHDTASRHEVVKALVDGGLAPDAAAAAVGSEFRDGYLLPKVEAPLSEEDQDPLDYKKGLLASEPGQTPGCIHDHEDADGKRYRHSHVGFDAPHRHAR